MIQRYIVVDSWNHKNMVYEFEDADGEWVKWNDIKHLMPFQEAIEKYLEKDIERLIKGTSTIEPKGICHDNTR